MFSLDISRSVLIRSLKLTPISRLSLSFTLLVTLEKPYETSGHEVSFFSEHRHHKPPTLAGSSISLRRDVFERFPNGDVYFRTREDFAKADL